VKTVSFSFKRVSILYV